jgi:DNA-directed RNA polymerase subunit RPC12/RpoP
MGLAVEAAMTYWFKCPGCEKMAAVDEDQAQARVSIQCAACGFHETGFVRPMVPLTTAMHPEFCPNRLLTEGERAEYDSLFGPGGPNA